MGSKNNADILITAYKRAETDADELIRYLDGIASVDDISEEKLPTLVKDLQNQKSAKTQEYLACASIVGGGVATSVGTTLACGALTEGVSAYGVSTTTLALASAYGAYASIGAAIPVLGWLVLPAVSIPMILKVISDSKIKKYRKENKDKFKQKQKRIEAFRNRIQNFVNEIQNQLNNVNAKLKDELDKKIKEYQEKTKNLIKEIALEIDDIVNVGANERILKYNEIILKQYKLQKELENKLEYLYTEYDKLLKEKVELEKKMGILVQLLNTMGCPESVINQALSE